MPDQKTPSTPAKAAAPTTAAPVNRPPVVDDGDNEKVVTGAVTVGDTEQSAQAKVAAEAEDEPVLSPATRAEMEAGRQALAGGSRRLAAADRK